MHNILEIIGPILTGLTFVLAYNFWRHQLRVNARNAFQTMLLDVDKTMIAHPELWAVYDTYATNAAHFGDHQKRLEFEGKRRAFVFMMLNMFEIIFAYYRNPDPAVLFSSHRLAPVESETRKTWIRYAKEFLRGSSFARDLWEIPATQEVYVKQFRAEINAIIAEIGKDATATLTGR